MPADYDGDSVADRAVFRPRGRRLVCGWSGDGVLSGCQADVPVPADYGGDRSIDRAVYRPAVGGWYVDGQPTVFYGLGTDIPLSVPAGVHGGHFGEP